MPGVEYDGNDSYGFMSQAETVKLLGTSGHRGRELLAMRFSGKKSLLQIEPQSASTTSEPGIANPAR